MIKVNPTNKMELKRKIMRGNYFARNMNFSGNIISSNVSRSSFRDFERSLAGNVIATRFKRNAK